MSNRYTIHVIGLFISFHNFDFNKSKFALRFFCGFLFSEYDFDMKLMNGKDFTQRG